MSYISGFMMGATIGKTIRQYFGTPSPAEKNRRVARRVVRNVQQEEGPLVLVSATPGRRRYRMRPVPASCASHMEARLKTLALFDDVKVNAATGSIVVTYAVESDAEVRHFMNELRRRLFPQPAKEDDAPDETHAGSMTRSIRRSGRALSAWINKTTGGVLDLNMLTILIFTVRGFQKMVMTEGPTAPQLFWWALSLLRGWRTV